MFEKETEFYVGQYQKDKSEGFGIYCCKDVEQYVGEWKGGAFNGQGIHDSKAYGNRFVGAFKNDKRVM